MLSAASLYKLSDAHTLQMAVLLVMYILVLIFGCRIFILARDELLCSHKSTNICTGSPLGLLVLSKEDEASLVLIFQSFLPFSTVKYWVRMKPQVMQGCAGETARKSKCVEEAFREQRFLTVGSEILHVLKGQYNSLYIIEEFSVYNRGKPMRAIPDPLLNVWDFLPRIVHLFRA